MKGWALMSFRRGHQVTNMNNRLFAKENKNVTVLWQNVPIAEP